MKQACCVFQKKSNNEEAASHERMFSAVFTLLYFIRPFRASRRRSRMRAGEPYVTRASGEVSRFMRFPSRSKRRMLLLVVTGYTARPPAQLSLRPAATPRFSTVLTAAAEATCFESVWITPEPEAARQSQAAALRHGDAVLCVPNAIHQEEIASLVGASIAAAELQRDTETGILPSRVRLHVSASLPIDAIALCDDILRRMLTLLDSQLPSIASSMFDSKSLLQLFDDGDLEYSAGEPAVNVYHEEGVFGLHKDHHALTVLIPLTSPDDGSFEGGGTGYWTPEDYRKLQKSPSDTMQPTIVICKEAGTALLFSGDVTHCGMPVRSGTRLVFVASFSTRISARTLIRRAEEREAERTRS